MPKPRYPARPNKDLWLVRQLVPQREATLVQQLDMMLRRPKWRVALDWLPVRPWPLGHQSRPDALLLRSLPRRQKRRGDPG